MQFPNQIQRAASPTLSDGSQPKRPFVMDEKSNKKEKIQKVRRVDSPTSPTDKNYVQVPSPQYSNKGKTSPKTVQGEKRSVSPKAMYPPSIQKYLNGKSNITIEEAVEKLKSPTNKTHKNNLEKMKLLSMLQTQEIESNIMFRKAYSNSTTSVSPAHSGSPLGSPKTHTSPKHEPEGGNIVMTFEESYPSLSPNKMMGGGGMEQVNNWNSGMMGNNGNNFPFGQAQQNQQQGFFNNSFQNQMGNNNNNNMNNNQNFGMNQGNFMGYQGQSGQYNQSQQGIQFNQYNQQQPFFNNQMQGQGTQNNNYNNNNNNFEIEEPRDRTTSFLMDVGNLGFMNQQNMGNGSQDTKWIVQNQINTIQSLVNTTKKTISPGEPSRGLMQMYQKRNSNPENIIRNPMSSQLYGQKDQSMGFNNGQGNNQFTGGGMVQEQELQQQQVSPHHLQQKLIETGMADSQNQGMNIQGQNQNLDFGFNNGGNNNWNNMDPFSNGNMIGEKIEENPDSFDPASYFALQNHKETDFDMNIIQSDVGFMPHGKSFDGLEEQLALPDTMGLEGLLSNPFTGYKFNN